MLEQIKCNLCGCEQYAVVYKNYKGVVPDIHGDDYTITGNRRNMPLCIVKCSNCGLIYANPRPPAESLIASYTDMVDAAYLEEESARRLSAQAVLNRLQRIKNKGRLLDVGCAAGFLLDEARKRGWEVFGLELSRWAAEYARNQLGLVNVSQAVLKQAGYPADYFDAVVLIDAIEHLTDPKETLIEISRILKSDGIICVNTPDIASLVSKIFGARWWGIKQAHLYYFTRRSLAKMLREAGFIPLITRTHARFFRLGYWISKLRDYSKLLYGICNFCLGKKLKDRLVRINLGDQIEVYYRKFISGSG